MKEIDVPTLTARALIYAKELDSTLRQIAHAVEGNSVNDEFHAKGAKYLAELIIDKLNKIKPD